MSLNFSQSFLGLHSLHSAELGKWNGVLQAINLRIYWINVWDIWWRMMDVVAGNVDNNIPSHQFRSEKITPILSPILLSVNIDFTSKKICSSIHELTYDLHIEDVCEWSLVSCVHLSALGFKSFLSQNMSMQQNTRRPTAQTARPARRSPVPLW